MKHSNGFENTEESVTQLIKCSALTGLFTVKLFYCSFRKNKHSCKQLKDKILKNKKLTLKNLE